MQRYNKDLRKANHRFCSGHPDDFFVRSYPAYSDRSITSVTYSQSRALSACRYLLPKRRFCFQPHSSVLSPFMPTSDWSILSSRFASSVLLILSMIINTLSVHSRYYIGPFSNHSRIMPDDSACGTLPASFSAASSWRLSRRGILHTVPPTVAG